MIFESSTRPNARVYGSLVLVAPEEELVPAYRFTVMGITGFLPLLRPVTKDAHVRDLKGLVSSLYNNYLDTSSRGQTMW